MRRDWKERTLISVAILISELDDKGVRQVGEGSQQHTLEPCSHCFAWISAKIVKDECSNGRRNGYYDCHVTRPSERISQIFRVR